jgi:hypothetical protein
MIPTDWSRLKTSTGSMTFSSNWPASEARQLVGSFPMTWKATWFTTSAMTGFTLPGMIEEPGWRAGRLSSKSPQRGVKGEPGDGEVLRASKRLDAVVGVGGYLAVAEEVVFDPGGTGWHHTSPYFLAGFSSLMATAST